MLLNSHLDHRLEKRFRELYTTHLERSRKIDWSYHEFLPWDRGQDFKSVPYEPGQGNLSEALRIAVETALLTEVNLPWFTSYLCETFKGSFSVMHDFIHTWTAEEDQHSSLLETYLLLTRNGDPRKLHQLRKQTVEHGWVGNFMTPLETLAYTTLQELATMVFYNNVARVAKEQDPVLSTLLRRLAKDEVLHYAFYRDAVKAHLEVDENYIYYIAGVMINFTMPGAVMPDYGERMSVIAREASYGPVEYFDQVFDVLVDYWAIPLLRPSMPEAEDARQRVLRHHERLKKVCARLRATKMRG
ncbi:acyl-ACP desaturase [Aneurinibacillus thermoaerophilus]|uniref:Acyl-ACP desaturase n=1 Tax=Aneurinibacillus thermoaerophilus TaxID=143495 RepID=A0A1G7Z3J5_ANETH|nr:MULTISPECIES: acyl-ACP desaturase [Aneurinibacillus]AMA72378.1 fatty acid desaturase [Aneurinibacillus sp. XH2]MED0674763.1 acyl-ACP desaturase [Aneurinibacillus thermoaerophilus]MED0679714.1 acyl-ACP desaturase [Aneurinibacillus thermoaerophilus]MED0757953.1 acyl-ACP desaturase [Aneurinibacillus thermoaerophilus]MED0760134.1 acyl-ACP desaturase [Aneurinibacillus thermoaerophilus]